jgi:hypothetical protein
VPYAQRVETGIVAVSGKLRLEGPAQQAAPEPILRGPTLILGPKGCFMFANAVDYEGDTDDGERCYDREKYIMWGFRLAARRLICLRTRPCSAVRM